MIALVAELADAVDSKSIFLLEVGVQVSLGAPHLEDFEMKKMTLYLLFVLSFLTFANSANVVWRDDIVFGKKNAPVDVYEFLSFSCYHCKVLFEEDFEKIKKDYIDTGKIRFHVVDMVYGNYNARLAHVAFHMSKNDAEAIRTMKWIFQNQEDWYNNNKPMDQLLQYLGLNLKDVRAKAGSKEVEKLFKRNIDLAESLGIKGTPTTFVVKKGQKLTKNSKNIVGRMPYKKFVNLVDSAL